MNELFIAICILALTDLILTVFWVYRWNSSKYVSMFKHKIPFRLIEANPIVRYFVENREKGSSLYIPIFFGYAVVFMIQLLLLAVHWILGAIVFGFLLGAIVLHVVNNIKTSNKHIIKMTVAYNKKMREGDGRV